MSRFFIFIILIISFILVLDRLFFRVKKDSFSKQIKSDLKIGREIDKSTDVIYNANINSNNIYLKNENIEVIKESTQNSRNEKVRFIKMNLEPLNISPPPEIINLKPNPE